MPDNYKYNKQKLFSIKFANLNTDQKLYKVEEPELAELRAN